MGRSREGTRGDDQGAKPEPHPLPGVLGSQGPVPLPLLHFFSTPSLLPLYLFPPDSPPGRRDEEEICLCFKISWPTPLFHLHKQE